MQIFGQMKNLSLLDLRYTRVTGEGLRYLAHLAFLTEISISNEIKFKHLQGFAQPRSCRCVIYAPFSRKAWNFAKTIDGLRLK